MSLLFEQESKWLIRVEQVNLKIFKNLKSPTIIQEKKKLVETINW